MASELAAHFPTRYAGAESETLLYYQQQQKRVLALLDFAATGVAKHLDSLADIDAWLLDQQKPDIFDDGDPRNVSVQQRQRFGAACAALAEAGYPRAQELTVFEFNSAVDYLIAKQKAD